MGEGERRGFFDGGPKRGPGETPAERAYRRQYVDRIKKMIDEVVHKNQKTRTEEEREVVKRHWRHIMRLLRIRELAENDNDTAIVHRVDAALARTEKHLRGKLEKLADKATGAPLKVADGGAK